MGKDEAIASIAPAYKTDAYVQRENRDRYNDRLAVKTNLIEAYDQLLAFAQKHLPDKFFLEGTQVVSLRDVICRELIANTLGSGTRNLFKYSWAYGGAQPALTEGDIFEASIPILKGSASAMGTSFDVDEVIFQMMSDYGYATVSGVAVIADVTERTVRRHISLLVTAGKIIATGTTRDRRYLLPPKADQ